MSTRAEGLKRLEDRVVAEREETQQRGKEEEEARSAEFLSEEE